MNTIVLAHMTKLREMAKMKAGPEQREGLACSLRAIMKYLENSLH